MNKISKKQASKNAEISKIKKLKPNICIICGLPCNESDMMHIFEKSIYPQYYINFDNLQKAHRSCHIKFDNNRTFRRNCKNIIEIAKSFATEQEINRRFDL